MLLKSYADGVLECGCDEAGRGCLAGAVYGAAVILPNDFHDPKLNDSKQLSKVQRNRLRRLIEAEAVAWCVYSVSAERIDEVNILNASHEAMSGAVRGLSVEPELLLIDGNLFRTDLQIPHHCIIGGDGRYMSIAAASILAKTHRDEYMAALACDPRFAPYDWASNKGYPTRKHREAIEMHGVTEHHRLTFGTGKTTKKERTK